MNFRLFNFRLGTLRCPHCREIVAPFHFRKLRYGSPLRTCIFCGERFIDKDYLEPALLPRGFKMISFANIALVITGIYNLASAVFAFANSIDITTVGLFNTVYLAFTHNPDTAFVGGLFLALGLIGIIRNSLYKPTPRELKLSRERIQEPDYIFALSDAGYDVPEETLNWASEQVSGTNSNDQLNELISTILANKK